MMDEHKICLNCAAAFHRDVRNTRAYWTRAKFCSSKCAGAYRAKQAAANREPLESAFLRRVDQRGKGCWEWTGLKDKDGYGLLPYAKKVLRAPVVALELAGRPVPKGLYACHTCDNPACVNPDHLYVGTPRQNLVDAISRQRWRPHTKLTLDQVLAIRQMAGTHEAIAARFGVSRATISLIKERKTWRHV